MFALMNLHRRFTYTLSFTLVQAVFGALVLLFAAYIGWEFYWYKRVGLFFVQWHTRLFPYLAVLLAMFGCWLLQGEKLKRWQKMLTATVFWMAVLEWLLGVLVYRNSDREVLDRFRINTRNFYHVYSPGTIVNFKKAEFTHARPFVNSLGYADKEWKQEKADSSVRILALGDSFTEGDGAEANEAYPVQLQNILNQKHGGIKYEVLNAGTGGSDPVFNLKNLEDRLAVYRPDAVIQTYSSNDAMIDFVLHDGFERFLPDTTLQAKPLPAIVYQGHFSRLARMLLFAAGIRGGDVPIANVKKHLLKVREIENEMLHRYDSVARVLHTQVIIVLLPLRSDVENEKYRYDFSDFKQRAANYSTIKVVDLMPCYSTALSNSNEKIDAMYWPEDGHHNSKGYAMMANCIATQLPEIKAHHKQ